jgi:F0F1-type ATP synthase membrane subunit b/b'
VTRAHRILRAGRACRIGLRPSAALLLVFAPVAAHASSEHGESGSMTWEVLNMALLLGVLFFVTRKPVSAYLADRRSEIASGLEHAEKLLIGAQARLAEWTRRELGLSEESAEIERAALDAARRDGEILIDGQRGDRERDASRPRSAARRGDRSRARARSRAAFR